MEVKLDSGVQTVLNAVDMSKYIPLFEEYDVNMKIFTTLNEDDLRTMGIEENDLEPILKYSRKLGKTESGTLNLDLQLEDIHKGVNIIEEHVKRIDIGLAYISDSIKPNDWIDQRVDEKYLSDITIETCEHIKDTCKELDDMLGELLKNDAKPVKKLPSKSLVTILSISALTIFVYFRYKFKYMAN